jgi:anti-anti-sigma factor
MNPLSDTPQYVECSHRNGHLVARVVVPSVGQAEAPVVRERIVEHLARLPRGGVFVLDLSQVSLLGSMGLGVCVDLRNQAERQGVRPFVYGLNKHLEDLFRLMRIEHLFKTIRTPQELDQTLGG